MTRFSSLVAFLYGMTLVINPAYAQSLDENCAHNLAATPYIDIGAPSIQRLATRLTSGVADDRGKALAIFRFVRDEIRFGFGAGFYDQKASTVLNNGIGFCNTKSTLFVALLRAAGIPARQVFVDIDAGILFGLLNPGTPFVDHSYTEVFLDGRWIATDAYIVDMPLFRAAKARLRRESRVLGYGVHVNGTNEWDGRHPSFAQFNNDGTVRLGSRKAQVFNDVGDFYARSTAPWNRLNWLMRQGFGMLASGGNAAADQLRGQQ
jgi:transglutaminase-like putative cysteine protease